MTQSTTQLANIALSFAQCSGRLNSYDSDTSPEARVARDNYEMLRDSMLREYLWNFSKKRAELSQVAPDPIYGYNNAYAYPADFLRLISVNPINSDTALVKYKLETLSVASVDTPVILTNAENVFLTYVRQVTSVAQFSADFYQALAWRLAAVFATAIKKDAKHADWCLAQFGKQISIAKSTNSIENWPDEQMAPGSWVTSRDQDDWGDWATW
jgi:hypothetical protein